MVAKHSIDCRDQGGGSMELSDVMRSQNACRYYKSDDVPNSVLYKAIDDARFGPQGGNRQPTRFVIVKDPAKKKRLGELYMIPWSAYAASAREMNKAIVASDGTEKATNLGMSNPEKALDDADNFAANFGNHPAIVVVCADIAETHPTDTELGRLSIVGGGSVYPIAQNFCLALRNQGVATTFTTLLCMYEPEIKELLGLPEEWATAAFIVAGYPEKPFPTKLFRHPVETMAYVDTWGNSLTN